MLNKTALNDRLLAITDHYKIIQNLDIIVDNSVARSFNLYKRWRNIRKGLSTMTDNYFKIMKWCGFRPPTKYVVKFRNNPLQLCGSISVIDDILDSNYIEIAVSKLVYLNITIEKLYMSKGTFKDMPCMYRKFTVRTMHNDLLFEICDDVHNEIVFTYEHIVYITIYNYLVYSRITLILMYQIHKTVPKIRVSSQLAQYIARPYYNLIEPNVESAFINKGNPIVYRFNIYAEIGMLVKLEICYTVPSCISDSQRIKVFYVIDLIHEGFICNCLYECYRQKLEQLHYDNALQMEILYTTFNHESTNVYFNYSAYDKKPKWIQLEESDIYDIPINTNVMTRDLLFLQEWIITSSNFISIKLHKIKQFKGMSHYCKFGGIIIHLGKTFNQASLYKYHHICQTSELELLLGKLKTVYSSETLIRIIIYSYVKHFTINIVLRVQHTYCQAIIDPCYYGVIWHNDFYWGVNYEITVKVFDDRVSIFILVDGQCIVIQKTHDASDYKCEITITSEKTLLKANFKYATASYFEKFIQNTFAGVPANSYAYYNAPVQNRSLNTTEYNFMIVYDLYNRSVIYTYQLLIEQATPIRFYRNNLSYHDSDSILIVYDKGLLSFSPLLHHISFMQFVGKSSIKYMMYEIMVVYYFEIYKTEPCTNKAQQLRLKTLKNYSNISFESYYDFLTNPAYIQVPLPYFEFEYNHNYLNKNCVNYIDFRLTRRHKPITKRKTGFEVSNHPSRYLYISFFSFSSSHFIYCKSVYLK